MSNSFAIDYYQRQNGNWDNPGTWTTSSSWNSTINTGTYPQAGDNAHLANNGNPATITLTSDAQCTNLFFDNSCTASVIAMGDYDLIVSGSWTTDWSNNGSITQGTGYLQINGGVGTINPGFNESETISNLRVGSASFSYGGNIYATLAVTSRYDYNCYTSSIPSQINAGNATKSNISTSCTRTLTATSLASFGNVCINTTTGPNSFTIDGLLLSNSNVTIAALNGYTFSTTVGGTYKSSLSLTQPGSRYSQVIYVKFTPTTTGTYNGTITVSGGGAPTVKVAVVGSGSTSVAPTVTTPTSANIGAATATLGGNITLDGCSSQSITERGIYYSTTSGFANGTGTKVSETGAFGTGIFSINVTGLSASTTYYYKAFATNSSGKGYSLEGTFNNSPLTYYSMQSGNWTSPSSWTTAGCGGTVNAGTYPAYGDNVFICQSHNITVDLPGLSCNNIDMTAYAGQLTLNNDFTINGKLTLSNQSYVSVGVNDLTIKDDFSNTGNVFNTRIEYSSGNITIGGNITISKGGYEPFTSTGTGWLIMSGTSKSFTVNDDITVPRFRLASSTITKAGSNKLTISSSFDLNNQTLFSQSAGTIDVTGTVANYNSMAMAYTGTPTFIYSGGGNIVGGSYYNLTTQTTDISIDCGTTLTSVGAFTNSKSITGSIYGAHYARIINTNPISNSGNIGASSSYIAFSKTISGGTVGANVLQNSSQVAQCNVTYSVPTGSATGFAVYTAVGAITNSGVTVIRGNLGTNAGAITGFDAPSTVTGSTHNGDTYTLQAVTDLNSAYSYLSTLNSIALGAALGNGQVLNPGVYQTIGASTINGVLTLDAQGDKDAMFIIRIGAALSTGANTIIKLTGSASMSNVYWQINGAFALAANSTFIGNTLVNGAISLLGGSTIQGNALSIGGAVTIANSTVTNDGLLNKYILLENNIISSPQTIHSGSTPSPLTGTLPTGGTVYTYSWESSITIGATKDFTPTTGTSQNYSPGALTQTTWFRRKVMSGIYSNTSPAIEITVLTDLPAIVPPDLGSASSFSVFTVKGNISNTGNSFIAGNIGTNSGTINGFSTATIKGTTYRANSTTVRAAADLIKANTYLNTLAGKVLGVTLGGGVPITPGIYNTGAAATLDGELILDAQGDPNAIFIIIISGQLATTSNSTIKLTNSADIKKVFWQVKGAFILGTSSVFKGTVISNGAITLKSGSSLQGNALTTAGAIDIINSIASNDHSTNIFDTDGNWSNVNNWSKGLLSTSSDNIIISAAAIVDRDFSYQDLTINLGGSVTIMPEESLTLTGNITNNAGTSGLVIKADHAKANGSLIIPNATNVNATVEMYSKAFCNNKNSKSDYKWQYFGIPVTSINASPTFDGSYVRQWDESALSATHWIQLTNSSSLNPFYGYEITQLDAGTIVFQGQLVNWDFTSPLLPFTSTASYPGQHIFANPFTAAIDIKKIKFVGDMTSQVFLYSTGSLTDWGSTGLTDSSPGQYQVVTPSTAGSHGIPGQIPSMQGFFVQVNSPLNATVTIPYSAVVKNTEVLRTKASIDTSPSEKVNTRIDVTGSNYSDKMWLFTDSLCTRKFDNGWDGTKMLGTALCPQIFAIEQDGIYQIDAVDDINGTQLGFQAGEDTNYTLTFTHSNITNKYAGVFLVDLVESKAVDITESGSTYSFLAESTPAFVKRFMIVSRNIEKDTTDKNTQLKVFSSGNTVFVQNLGSLNGEMNIYDMMGRFIRKANFGPYGVTAVQVGSIQGAYVVNAVTTGEKVSKRIILGK